ncbi:bifunctional nicotinamidase/pyrazinamidase [Enterovirga rhinocerotis]|uniref:Nicotinamidase n=1 Tax=Enterovirga rhinocerotis TaxID=1339210 RepID=A0A4R7BW39_9HYPH|nr:bifunctional nicotinamidase/pyrazinamidase [Enterovirga rhinocerotis]TDR89683.1 nicotinamidase/pyrazinamidase [Enterovirga rhinocerotis]
MTISRTDALLVVDVQNDFLPGGRLAVPDGDAVIALANALVERFEVVVATQDWHPPGHLSFASSHEGKAPFETVAMPYGPQVLWPDHCVRGTDGAAFAAALRIDKAQLVIRKGHHLAIDSYSAFVEADRTTPTGLAGYLRERGIEHLYLCGLATDFCVVWTALDGRAAGFAVSVVEDGCRAIDLDGSLDRAWTAMAEAGVRRIRSPAVLA